MNNEELLQSRLEMLEAGASLDECTAGLAPEQAEMLRLANMMRQVPIPVQRREALAAQRAELLSVAGDVMASDMNARAGQRRPPIREWLRQRTGFDWVLAGGLAPSVALVVLVILMGLLGGPQSSRLGGPQTEGGPAMSERGPGGAESEVAVAAGPASGVDAQAVAGRQTGESDAGGQSYALFMPVLSNPLVTDPSTAAVLDIQGVVEVQDAEGAWKPVRAAAKVGTGGRLRTGALSSATLLFHDGSQARLGPETEVTLDSVDAQTPDQGFRTVIMTQLTGQSEHQVAFRNDAGSLYEVQTPSGSGIARGTIFDVLVSPDLVSQYRVDEGAVAVSGSTGTVLVRAHQISTVSPGETPSSPSFVVTGQGEVTATGDTWMIGGQEFTIQGDTVFVGDPQLGDIVLVLGHLDPGGVLVADQIFRLHDSPTNEFTLVGRVDSMGPTEWEIAGTMVAVSEQTIIDDDIEDGDLVRATGIIEDDGTLFAEKIELIEDTGEGMPFEFTGVVQDNTGNPWLISGVEIYVNDDTDVLGEITGGDVVKVEGMILEDGTWLAEEIKLVSDDDAEFEFTGIVESIDPWMVSGISFETDDDTEIDDDIEVDDLVQVEGRILDDGTWLAEEIELLDDSGEVPVSVVLIGYVEDMDPWTVSGFVFDTDDDTEIDPDIAEGDLVRVKAIILDDGTWLALKIELLGDDEDETGCFTITAVVLGISGDELTIGGWPVIIIGDDVEVDGEIAPGTIVVISICMEDDGTLVVKSILVIGPITPPPPDDGGGRKVTLCHKPDGANPHDLTVAEPAVQAHLNHGDTLGSCNGQDDDDDDGDDDDGDDDRDDEGRGEARATVCHKPDSAHPQSLTISQSAVDAHLGHGDTIGACSDDSD